MFSRRQAGFHLLDIVDNATGGFPLLFVGLFETIAISFIYGVIKFKKDIEMMIAGTPFMRKITDISFFYFIPMWAFVTPLCLLAVIVFKCYQYKTLHEKDPVVFPEGADAIWWLIVLFPLLVVPAWFLAYEMINGGWQLLIKICSPKSKWGPALSENRTGRYEGAFDMSAKGSYDNTGYSHEIPAPDYITATSGDVKNGGTSIQNGDADPGYKM